jgi:subtilisin family serine protease
VKTSFGDDQQRSALEAIRSIFIVFFWCVAASFVVACSVFKPLGKAPSGHEQPLAVLLDEPQALEHGYVVRFPTAAGAQRHRASILNLGGQTESLDGTGRVLRVELPSIAGAADRRGSGTILVERGASVMVDAPLSLLANPMDEDSSESERPEDGSHFAQNLVTASKVVGVADLRRRFPAADGRHETIAILDTGIEFGTPGLSTFADGSRKVVGYFDFTAFGRVRLQPLSNGDVLTSDSAAGGLDIGGVRYVFGALTADTQLLAKGELSEPSLARDVHEPKGIDLDGNGSVQDTFGLALTVTGDRLELWVDINSDRIFFDRGAAAHERESLQDFNSTGRYLDARTTITAKGRPLAVTLPSAASVTAGSSVDVQFHSVLGSHGTACASIASGDKYIDGVVDGMAPKSRLLSYVIDATGRDVYRASTLLRQFFAARDQGATAISVSWGFATADLASAQAFADILDQEVASKGVVIAMAAGNGGPGSRSASSNDYIPRLGFAIGAAITEQQSRNVYGWLGVQGDHVIHYSSAGPTRNGRASPDLVSPLMTLARARRSGDANAFVPFGGTSSATPAFIGALASLTSVLRDQGVPVHAGILRDAVFRTTEPLAAVVPADRQGLGLFNVNKAYDAYLHLLDLAKTQQRIDFSLLAHVKVDGASQPSFDHSLEPEGLVARSYVPYFRIGVTPVFRDDPAMQPGETGSFASPLRVIVHYDDASMRPWLEVPESIVVQANGAEIPVRVHPSLSRRVGLYTAEVRFLDDEDVVRLRVPVRLSLSAPHGVQGEGLALEGSLQPFSVHREPVFLEKPTVLALSASFLLSEAVPSSRAVVSLFDQDGHLAFRTDVSLDAKVTSLRAVTPELPPGHYELQVFQQPGVLVQRLKYILGVARLPFALAQERASNGMMRFYLRNESSVAVHRMVLTLLGRERSVTLRASPDGSPSPDASDGPASNHPAFRGQLDLAPQDRQRTWAVALVQSPVERLLRPFSELAVAYSNHGDGRPLAWDWLPVSEGSQNTPVRWATVRATLDGQTSEEPSLERLTVRVAAYPNVGRWEKLASASLLLRVRSFWREPVQISFSRDSKVDQDWILPDIPDERLGSTFADDSSPVYGELSIFGPTELIGKLPVFIGKAAGL